MHVYVWVHLNSKHILKGYKMDFQAELTQFQLLSAMAEQEVFAAANNTETVNHYR